MPKPKLGTTKPTADPAFSKVLIQSKLTNGLAWRLVRNASICLLLGLAMSCKAQTFTRSSTIEMGLAAGSIAADGVTTQGFIGRGCKEMNPLARPFVQSKAGTTTYFGGSFALVVLANNRLRNHHRWRHVLNWSVIGTETFFTVHNYGLKRRSQ